MADAKYKEQVLTEECGQCLLCEKGACAEACPYGIKTDEVIRSIRFENISGAAAKLPKYLPCDTCEGKPCKTACIKSKINKSVAIDEIMKLCSLTKTTEKAEADLSIDFCGLHCENPFFLSSSVVGSGYEMIAKAFEMGWSGVVYKTITSFTHDEVSPRFAALKKEANPFIGFKNLEQTSEKPLKEDIDTLKRLKNDYPDKIVIASIMGQNEEDWSYLAKLSTEAGVDALELNFSCPHMAHGGMGSDVGENPEVVAEYVKAVKKATNIPVIAKTTPNTGNMVPSAVAAVKAGADALAAINTIKSIMNIHPESFVSEPEICQKSAVGGYSGKAVKPIACRFIYDMATSKELKGVPLTGMGGIETWKDAMEFIALGCTNIQVTTSVMQYGYRIIEDMIDGMKRFLYENGFDSITEIVGAALPNIIQTDELERRSICYPKFSLDKCVGCGRCYISCFDGGHQALAMVDKKPRINAEKCVGCHLCLAVCPAGAISAGPRVGRKM
ncbi:MAG: NAD-dependent dihydropyrimidine dehydrogenase subunit PreA [Clostridia bacterium]|jgi:dihydropyrimidine dehydrogenase (NAD+) subunit PreA|nr:NAD-dependent dihydropyrimidine dehydrogenase subunit PreA [Clostridia bacterium]MCI2015279.1 NAD-dependent dihydropyrimidine dehydrogenase subunit PreA [Clostridia bacterium]